MKNLIICISLLFISKTFADFQSNLELDAFGNKCFEIPGLCNHFEDQDPTGTIYQHNLDFQLQQFEDDLHPLYFPKTETPLPTEDIYEY
jgi:hypothetical protein